MLFEIRKGHTLKKDLLNSTSHRTSCNNCGSYLNNLLVMPLLRHHHIQSHFILFHPFCLILGSGLFRPKIHKIPHTWSTVQSWFGSVFFSGDYLFLSVNFTDEFSVPFLLWRQKKSEKLQISLMLQQVVSV